MGERRVLVIGSQCQQLNLLSFLPQMAQDLYTVLTDPELGGCISALQDKDGLFIDPTVDDARDAIKAAFKRASHDEATLFLAFIGHGEFSGRDFYLLPSNASAQELGSDTAIHLVQLIKELYRAHSNLDGLVVLLDTCFSGVAAAGAAAQWVSELAGTLRFEVLTAAADRPAADGCFSRHLVACMKEGLDSVPSETLRCEHLKKVIENCCPNQVPQHPAYNPDDGLFLAKNRARFARKEPWVGTGASGEIERLTSWFQPTPPLEELVAASTANRCVVVVGDAGTGKSALAAGLARPEITEGSVPDRFVQAIVFLSGRTTAHELALQVAEQLTTSLPAFASAREDWSRYWGLNIPARTLFVTKSAIGKSA